MPRNINRRVEVLFPIQDREIVRYLRNDVLEIYLVANTKVREMQPNGSYITLQPKPKEPIISPQDWLIKFHQQAN